MGKLRSLLRDYIARIIIETFSVDSLKKILSNIVTYLKEQAENTENIVDDWIIEALENIVNDPKKLEIIYQFIKRYIIPADGVCCSLPTNTAYASLTQELVNVYNDETFSGDVAKAIGFAQWLQLVELVIPILVDAYERFIRDKR